MSRIDDQALLEAVRTHRERLRSAFVFGSSAARRTTSTLIPRLFVSVVLAAAACAGVAGTAFVLGLLNK